MHIDPNMPVTSVACPFGGGGGGGVHCIYRAIVRNLCTFCVKLPRRMRKAGVPASLTDYGRGCTGQLNFELRNI